jgi:hypothetical protein
MSPSQAEAEAETVVTRAEAFQGFLVVFRIIANCSYCYLLRAPDQPFRSLTAG